MAGISKAAETPLATEEQLVEILETFLGADAVTAWYKSKTLWFAALTIVLGAAQVFGYIPAADPEVSGGIVTVIGAIFAVLRTVTRRPLA